jgi:hypothetical protein
LHFLHWFGPVRAALVEVPEIRQSNAARKRRKKVVEGVAGRAGRDTINGFSAELRRLGVTQKHSRPNHPTTCGKVERFHQTLKKWLTTQTRQPAAAAHAAANVGHWRSTKNLQRHRVARPRFAVEMHQDCATAHRTLHRSSDDAIRARLGAGRQLVADEGVVRVD